MGRVFLVELGGRAYRCRFCNSPLALADDVLSKSFNCRQGRAFLFSKVDDVWSCGYVLCACGRVCMSEFSGQDDCGHSRRVNVTVGAEEERLMLTGMHTVEDVFCCCCGQILGWKYVTAHDKSQKYKEGKFVLERWRIMEEVTEDFNLEAPPGSSDVENA